ncbi:helix-turn-helix domain-containing protein [Bradyrhizobium betae]|uniref:Helix-turn-helix domain-containing protein n=1 Tax=Bradyrhizobium betae TaxID=244734 RepID=A0A5P6P6Z7_9BRAD|nr:helix-turn-helix domain-containing protein [Bradyrhizobium betae]MCS3731360.1 putative transcriptional regulator [Bradyrhizobium betae]QFI73956.1 helix-turn-helix domain-containing protein [Bradyrhizobium betae]
MPVTPLETLLAHKVINLAVELSGAEKRVAGALIDHFNRRTGQCDPSLNTLADLIGMSRRTVMRAVARLERLGLFRKVRHGGKFHRNSYEPIWSSFREAEDRWNDRRRSRKQKFASLGVSPSTGPTRHPEGDGHGHQTYSSNPLYKTLAVKRHEGSIARVAPVASSATKLPRKEFEASNARAPTTSSADVARIAAERRWSDNLRCELSTKVAVYGAIVDFIDEPLRIAATEAELNCRGAGLRLILQRYRDSAAEIGGRDE